MFRHHQCLFQTYFRKPCIAHYRLPEERNSILILLTIFFLICHHAWEAQKGPPTESISKQVPIFAAVRTNCDALCQSMDRTAANIWILEICERNVGKTMKRVNKTTKPWWTVCLLHNNMPLITVLFFLYSFYYFKDICFLKLKYLVYQYFLYMNNVIRISNRYYHRRPHRNIIITLTHPLPSSFHSLWYNGDANTIEPAII